MTDDEIIDIIIREMRIGHRLWRRPPLPIVNQSKFTRAITAAFGQYKREHAQPYGGMYGSGPSWSYLDTEERYWQPKYARLILKHSDRAQLIWLLERFEQVEAMDSIRQARRAMTP